MADARSKDLLARLADLSEEAIQRLSDAPGADRVAGTLNSLRERLTRWIAPAKRQRSRFASTVLPGCPGSGDTPTIAIERGRSSRSMREVVLASMLNVRCPLEMNRAHEFRLPTHFLLASLHCDVA